MCLSSETDEDSMTRGTAHSHVNTPDITKLNNLHPPKDNHIFIYIVWNPGLVWFLKMWKMKALIC